jgi:Putative cell wall-binding domain
MNKKSTRALASGALMSLVLTTVLSVGPAQAAAGQVTRTSGVDRYATAAQVAKANWATGAKDVVLVTGEGYADAVSASALAKQLNAPILLTTPAELNSNAKDALKTLNPQNVYIVGGNASVSESVRTELKASNYNLVELQGADRYETNVAVAKKLVELGVKADNVMLVGGEGFSDALSVAPVAAAKGQILLLGSNNTESMQSVINFVKANNSKVTVIGTTNIIGEDMYKAIGAVERVNGGASRFETNMNVLNKYAADLKADKLFVANASGNGYADALVASALAGKTASPLVLVDAEGADATTTAINYIKSKATKTTDLNVVGGEGVVSKNTVKAIDNIFNPGTTTGQNTVSQITAINLNQFDVVFNSNVDEDTAELTSNYKVAGTQLTSENAHVELISDNTVRITLVQSVFEMGQGEEATVSVKKGILTADKTKTIEDLDKKIEFKDVTAPTIKTVSVRGNNKLVVEFSEAVNMNDLTVLKSLIQVNGKSLSNVEATVKEAATKGTETWASKVEFYFSTGLNSGENTVKIKDAKSGVLVDAAGFSFKEGTATVSVDAVTTAPEVKEITATDDGEIRVKFDRPMDAKTAVKVAYYTINDKVIDGATIELKDDDTTVKITGIADGILKDNTNIIEITDDVKDAYGNKVADDTRVTFNKEKDETKPTVVSATILDSKTLRVQFSEDVKYAYATNLDNYEIKDAYNVDLMTKAGVTIVAADATSATDTDDTDTYDIKFNGTATLNSSKYTLTIKNVVDKATEANKMDDYTLAIDGNDDEAPSVDDLDVFVKSSTEVAVYFGKEMDQASIADKANYYYINGDGESNSLPDDVDITVSADNKGVVIDFDNANKTVEDTVNATAGDDIVKKIGIKTVKDASGNELYAGALTINAASTNGPKLEDNTFKLYTEGDDVKASFQLDSALDTINPADFKVSSIAADDADFDGKTVILTFKEGTSADAVKALGTTAELQISPSATDASQDIAGRDVKAGTETVYNNAIAPETDRDNYSATVTLDAESKVASAVVNITMKTPVDGDILGSYKDDFVFTNATKGTKLDVISVTQNGNTLVFTIKDAATKVAAGDKIDITAATNTSNIDIRTAEDGDGNSVKYVPSTDDMKVKTVTVK